MFSGTRRPPSSLFYVLVALLLLEFYIIYTTKEQTPTRVETDDNRRIQPCPPAPAATTNRDDDEDRIYPPLPVYPKKDVATLPIDRSKHSTDSVSVDNKAVQVTSSHSEIFYQNSVLSPIVSRPRRVMLNFGASCCERSKRTGCTMGILHGMDECHSYDWSLLPPWFLQENADVLSRGRGAGYWLWKPYAIYYTMLNYAQEGDVVFYMDAGSHLSAPVDVLVDFLLANLNTNQGVLSFELPFHKDRQYTKRDAFILMDADTPEYTDSIQRLSSFVMLRKSAHTMKFVETWLAYARDSRSITDDPNTLGPNYPEFIDNRHDQSIYSILCKKWGIPPNPDPSQCGDERRAAMIAQGKTPPYPTVIEHTRDRG